MQVFYFTKTECPPCQVIKPMVVEAMQTDWSHLDWSIESLDNGPTPAAKRFNVMKTPTIVIVRNGKVHELVGGQNCHKLNSVLTRLEKPMSLSEDF